MSYENKGSIPVTFLVTRDPDRSGNLWCNGIADDVEIKAAIAYTNAVGGGYIHISKGIYIITTKIVLETGIQIWGSGYTTVLQQAGAGAEDQIFFIEDKNHVEIAWMRLIGTNTTGDGIEAYGSDNNKFHNLWIEGTGEEPIALYGCDRNWVYFNDITNWGTKVASPAIDISNDDDVYSDDNYVAYNQIRNGAGPGIHIRAGDRNKLICNNITSVSTSGIILNPTPLVITCYDNEIRGGTINQPGANGIIIANFDHTSIVDVRIIGTDIADSYGIIINPGERTTIKNPKISDFDYGIAYNDSDDIVIMGGWITGCAVRAVTEWGTSDYARLIGTNLRGNAATHTVDAANSEVAHIVL